MTDQAKVIVVYVIFVLGIIGTAVYLSKPDGPYYQPDRIYLWVDKAPKFYSC